VLLRLDLKVGAHGRARTQHLLEAGVEQEIALQLVRADRPQPIEGDIGPLHDGPGDLSVSVNSSREICDALSSEPSARGRR
jgi:hypothetical protein